MSSLLGGGQILPGAGRVGQGVRGADARGSWRQSLCLKEKESTGPGSHPGALWSTPLFQRLVEWLSKRT